MASSNCDNSSISPVCYGKESGLFNADQSSTVLTGISFVPYGTYGSFGLVNRATGAVPEYAITEQLGGRVDIGGATVIPDVSIALMNQSYRVYPGGSVYPVEVGTLSLGAPNLNHTFTTGDGVPAINLTFVNSYLYTSGGPKKIPSYSYGMHIGSVPLNIPGSLMLGGYDQSRTIGDVSSQSCDSAELTIKLVDIGIGVATGGSPWAYASKTGLLVQGNSSIDYGTTVMVLPTEPYIYLPKSSCDSITAELPVTYHAKYGLYFWNTDDPDYERIVSSPACLAFTFPKDEVNTANITIKVPFMLLNLTLEAPLLLTPTPYFPCMPSDGPYSLGRAFLQAAFVGVNWHKGTGVWFLAQAPGPDYQSTPSTTVINPRTAGKAPGRATGPLYRRRDQDQEQETRAFPEGLLLPPLPLIPVLLLHRAVSQLAPGPESALPAPQEASSLLLVCCSSTTAAVVHTNRSGPVLTCQEGKSAALFPSPPWCRIAIAFLPVP